MTFPVEISLANAVGGTLYYWRNVRAFREALDQLMQSACFERKTGSSRSASLKLWKCQEQSFF